jgi:UDP-2-acetamido-3-amino-2,3-dideoxy-glucuronate N-acetyltransferase
MNNVTIWYPANVYGSAKIGQDVSIGMFSEIGHNVKIGDRTRVGALSFIPEGVEIGSDCFIGPRCTFTNDKYPPSGKEAWLPTIVEDGARIGAAVTIICGVRIGKNALIGAGSVVTKDVPEGATAYGVPAEVVSA